MRTSSSLSLRTTSSCLSSSLNRATSLATSISFSFRSRRFSAWDAAMRSRSATASARSTFSAARTIAKSAARANTSAACFLFTTAPFFNNTSRRFSPPAILSFASRAMPAARSSCISSFSAAFIAAAARLACAAFAAEPRATSFRSPAIITLMSRASSARRTRAAKRASSLARSSSISPLSLIDFARERSTHALWNFAIRPDSSL
mmetsp:Transcript_22238/g.56356  ORF Transcript_22238/g.56356 Transcript_22238/m.56356 type:complete len:205 (-) Transcript_22238:706-1320(-)